MTCPKYNGRGISYTDERTGDTDHMNAHLCGKCSGTGRVLDDCAPVVCEQCKDVIDPHTSFSTHLHRVAEATTHNDERRTFLVVKCPRHTERQGRKW